MTLEIFSMYVGALTMAAGCTYLVVNRLAAIEKAFAAHEEKDKAVEARVLKLEDARARRKGRS